MSFKDLIIDSQDQEPTCKWRVIVGAGIDKIRGQIEKIRDFSGKLRLKLNKLKIKDSFVKGFKL
jgi:hypothetical protein